MPSIVGVYGPNPRFTKDAASGAAQLEAAASLLAERAAAALHGEPVDPFADLRLFVERYWPERLGLAGRAGTPGERPGGPADPADEPGAGLALRRREPGSRSTAPSSRLEGLTLVNPTVGETGEPFAVASLGPEHGFYVRRLQTAELRLPVEVAPGRHPVELTSAWPA